MKLHEITSYDHDQGFQVGDLVKTRQRQNSIAFHHSVPLNTSHDEKEGRVTSVNLKKKELLLVNNRGFMWTAHFDDAELA